MKKNNLKRQAVSRPLTEKVLGRYIGKVIKTIDKKIDETKKTLEINISETKKALEVNISETKKVLEAKIGETKKALEAKIEYSRRDASEQIHSVKKAVNARIDAFDTRIDKAVKELKEDIQLNRDAIKSVKDDIVDMETRLTEKLASKEELKTVEINLSDKIETIGVRLEEHEAKPIGTAHPQ
jgi:cytochrome P450